MKLPKQLAEEQVESDVRAALERGNIALCQNSDVSIPLLTLTPALRKQLFFAHAIGELTISYEAIEKYLLNELRGLSQVENRSARVSRLLIVTHDGSDRFYRGIESLHRKHGGRILICRLDVSSITLGNTLGFKDTPVKAVLINRKKSVVNVLKSLVSSTPFAAQSPQPKSQKE